VTISFGRHAPDLTWLVALGAGLWGTDALFRSSLARQVSAPTLVFAEHLVLVLVLLPFLPRSVRAFGRLDARARGAVIAIGAGASAVATTLFTMAFKISSAQGDFVTPVVVQHLQPLFAIAGAVVVLREKVRTKFAAFAVPGILGVWLLAFPNPLSVSVSRVSVVLLALAAAALWAGGTVLGRLVAVELEPVELTTLRFAVGLPAAAVIVVVSGSDFWVPDLSSSGAVVGLALVPGLLAMVLYYVGLRRTAASRATLADRCCRRNSVGLVGARRPHLDAVAGRGGDRRGRDRVVVARGQSESAGCVRTDADRCGRADAFPALIVTGHPAGGRTYSPTSQTPMK